MQRSDAIQAMAELKIKHRAMRQESGEADAAAGKARDEGRTVDAAKSAGRWLELKAEMDVLRQSETEILSHFENTPGDPTGHQKMHNEANALADALSKK